MKLTPTIAIIDDDYVCNMLSERMIKKVIGGEITSYTNPVKAVKDLISRTKLPDYILLDINMPNMNGWEFLEQLNKEIGSLNITSKVIILTSSVRDSDRVKAKTFSCIKNFSYKPLEQKDISLLFDTKFKNSI
tara:strand:+ start:1777 stop:2175 length:399 start_codon:yes stop_codon:yes gene_type:complete